MGEVVLLVCFLWHSPLSISSLYMSLTLALSGEKSHYGLEFCPCSQMRCLGEAPQSSRVGGVSGSFYSLSGQSQPQINVFCFFPSVPLTSCSPCLCSSSSFFPHSSLRQPGFLTSQGQMSRPWDSFLSVFLLNPILREAMQESVKKLITHN